MYGHEKVYDFVKDLGVGNFGTAKLLRHRQSGHLVAAKYIERGEKIDKNVEREIINHHQLSHPKIVRFIEVYLTPTHLTILMEFAAGGELFDRIVQAGHFSEDESRYFFQQLVSGVDYCHQCGICHRDLKLENTLLDGSVTAPKLKICDFGYSKSSMDSQPKSTVGTPAYISPEVLQRRPYSGQAADVWSCGVTLYVMLIGAYPFEDSQDPRNFRKTIQRIMGAKFSIPPGFSISPECMDLLSKIFRANPKERITMAEIWQHPWFVKNLPQELTHLRTIPVAGTQTPQSVDNIKALVQAARTTPSRGPLLSQLLGKPLPMQLFEAAQTPQGQVPPTQTQLPHNRVPTYAQPPLQPHVQGMQPGGYPQQSTSSMQPPKQQQLHAKPQPHSMLVEAGSLQEDDVGMEMPSTESEEAMEDEQADEEEVQKWIFHQQANVVKS